MAGYERGLRKSFDVFEREFNEKKWLHNLIKDDEVFLFIRDEYINFYYLGCSILKLKFNSRKKCLTGETHFKYLLNPKKNKSSYVSINCFGEYKTVNGRIRNIHDIKAFKKLVIPYAKGEKVKNQEIIKKNLNIIDIEIAVGRGSFIDLAAIHKCANGAEITFYETKLFNNHDLRPKNQNEGVYKQMQKYSKWICENQKSLIQNCRKLCENFVGLNDVTKTQYSSEIRELIKIIADGAPLFIKKEPELIITGFNLSQLNHKNWGRHQEKLNEMFGDRLWLLSDD
ncbi:MAG: hypothetical protein OXH65_07015 [Paracoccaceae bacterium]|nr:hypothetical protein [Paracoccaceae bacterium]